MSVDEVKRDGKLVDHTERDSPTTWLGCGRAAFEEESFHSACC
jgi:hypothetical protein